MMISVILIAFLIAILLIYVLNRYIKKRGLESLPKAGDIYLDKDSLYGSEAVIIKVIETADGYYIEYKVKGISISFTSLRNFREKYTLIKSITKLKENE